jgi:DNA gyrase subunit B
VRGVKEVAVIDQALIGSADATSSMNCAFAATDFPRPTPPAMLRRKDETIAIHGPVGLFKHSLPLAVRAFRCATKVWR